MKKTLTFCFINLLTVSLSFSQVVINEIMYNPYYETTPGDPNTYYDDDDGEFIELFNAGQSDVDISGSTKTKISERVREPINKLIKYKFQKMFLEDKLFTALPNINSWLATNFNQLNHYASKTHE